MVRFELTTICLRSSRSAVKSYTAENWCPRMDLNHRPSVCRTAALAGLSYAGMVGRVGIEPTFRVLQTRANPSQLSTQMEPPVRIELT